MTLGIIIALYFVPALIAAIRGHHQVIAIFLLNLLLGWTLLGWVAALVWSATARARPINVVVQNGAAYPAPLIVRATDNPFPAGTANADAWDRGVAANQS